MTQLNSDYSPDDASPLDDDEGPPSPLGQVAAAAPADTSMGTLHQENHQRYLDAQNEMRQLQRQYSNLSGQNADAYAAQKKLLLDATERLNNLNFGPTPEEARFRNLAAFTDASHGGYGFNPSEVNATRAQLLKEGREGELQKAQLMAQYGMQIPQATLQANNQQMNQNLAMQRIAGQQTNNAATAAERGNQPLPWYVKQDAQGNYYLPPGAEKVLDQAALAKLFGRFTLVPQADGSKRIVAGAQIAAGAAAPGGTPQPGAQTPHAPNTAPNAPSGGGTQPLVTPQFLSGLFQPSNILSSKYGALTQATKPAYVQTATQAFAPDEFSQYRFTPDWRTNNQKAMIAQLEAKDKEMGTTVSSSQNTINNYGHALAAMDGLQNDPRLMTGTFGDKQAAFENAVRGLPGGESIIEAITGDKGLQALAAKQDSDKYFRQAATAGLQAVYHGRITNQELSTQLASLPSSNLMPAVARLLAKAQTDVAQDSLNKAKIWGVYRRNGGDPSLYDTFYDSHFSPFSTDSLLIKNLQAKQPQTATPNPLVKYYTDLAAWKAGGQKGPAPQKPQ